MNQPCQFIGGLRGASSDKQANRTGLGSTSFGDRQIRDPPLGHHSFRIWPDLRRIFDKTAI